jgi:hypothetical protein
MKSVRFAIALPLALSLFACTASKEGGSGFVPTSDSGSDAPITTGDDTGTTSGDDSGGLVLETGAPDGGTATGGTSTIYASTNTELWGMDPATKSVTKIGAFDFGSMTSENITDVAVNGNGDVWVCSETHVYTAAMPAGGTGAVKLTLKLTLPSTSKFYALGFAPAGVLETGEGLVAGDSLGDLYYIPTNTPAPSLQKLGGFGACKTGDPSPCKSGSFWELSGDVVFYTSNGQPKGLATLRACSKSSTGSTTCSTTNDVVAEVDMAALATKNPGAVLRKQILGGGTGFGRTFGVGAWEDKVYGFTYAGSSSPAQLISVDSTGTGTLVQAFSSLTGGWTGAGVSTKAAITVIQ